MVERRSIAKEITNITCGTDQENLFHNQEVLWWVIISLIFNALIFDLTVIIRRNKMLVTRKLASHLVI